MSRSEDESVTYDDTAGGTNRPPTRFRFGDVDKNREEILKKNKLKYSPRKPSVLLCLALGVFLLPGLVIYLVGLLIYNKVAEYQFNKKQAQDLEKAKEAVQLNQGRIPDRSETDESSYASSGRRLSRSRRASASQSTEDTSRKKKTASESPRSSGSVSSSSEEESHDDTESPTPRSPNP